jgi:hypothetical protein
LEADPLRPVYANLDEVWVGPTATELVTDARTLDRDADAVGGELRRVAAVLDRRAWSIEAAEAAAAEAAAAAEELAAHGATAASPSSPPNWH